MNASNVKVKGLVEDIRKRWRRRALIQGGAVTLLTLLFFATVLLVLYTTVAVRPVALLVGVGVAAAVVLGVVGWFVWRPGLRRLSDQQIALYVEEKFPDLEDRLNSAVEVGEADDALRKEHGALIDHILDDAALRTKAIPLTTVIDRRRERLLTYTATAFLVAFLVFGYTSLDKIQFTASGFDLIAATATPPFMTVEPGNVEIEKGASQEVIVTLRDAPEQDVVVVYKEGDGEWIKEAMQQGLGQPSFLQEFFNVQEPIQYYVEVGETRSEPYQISLYEFPDVSQIDVTYRYPDYTGLPPRTEEDNGDIRGLKGSTVTVTVQTTGAVETAEMILNEAQTISLQPIGEGRFRGSLKLEEEALYFVRLKDEQNKENKFPDEYQVVPVEDEKPYITITDPQRDVRVNAIEEVLVAASVRDDYGVKDLRLVFTVNAGDEQTLRLMDDATERPQETGGEHLFFLEDYQLEPGDVISYYVEAEDYFHPAAEATDMYFVEVIPFDQKFSQAANMGGMPGGQQPSGLVLSQQEIIAATWKLLRQRDEMADEDFDESIKGLSQAQANLKANIEERLNATAFSLELRGNETQQKVVDYLRQATEEMDNAVRELDMERLKQALTPERKALNNLLRADALNKENQVAMNQGQQGGGGSATEERMTELMDLELDISKDKYEVQQQRSQQQQQSQQLDEALQRVQDLARRQQNLANQNRLDELEGEDKKRFIEQLKREQEELREQIEQLANNMQQMNRNNSQNGRPSNQNDSQSQQQMQQSLDRIARDMREAERALRREDLQQTLTRQQQALNELQRLEQELRMAATDDTREMLEDLAEQFDQFRDQEQQLDRDIDKAAEDARLRGGQADEATSERLEANRQNMLDNLDRLMDQAEAVEERVRQEDQELATALRNMIQQARREGLEENMLNSRDALEQGWLDYAQRLEEEIETTLEGMEAQRRAFENTLPVTEEEELAQSLDDLRALTRQLEDLQAQAERMQQQQGRQQGQQQQGQQEGQQQEGQQQSQQQGQGSPNDRQGRADAARMQRQLDRAQETLDRLQQDFANNPAMQRELNRLQNNLTRADHTGVLLDEESAKDFFNERVYDPLSQLEMDLARQLDLIAMEKKLYGSRTGDVPPEYRELVEKYYESLSKSGDQQ